MNIPEIPEDEESGKEAVACAVPLNELADQIREYWIHNYRLLDRERTGKPSRYASSPRWDGGRTASGRKYQAIWPKIAEIVQRLDIVANLFVSSFFADRHGQMPTPSQLLSNGQIARYREALDLMQSSLLNDFQVQCQAARQALVRLQEIHDERTALWLLVATPTSPISALFRYCLAEREGFQDLTAIYHRMAVSQYRTAPAKYDEIWDQLIPDNIRSAVNNHRQTERSK